MELLTFITTLALDLLGNDYYKLFVLANKFGINAMIAFLEVFALNSIKRPQVCYFSVLVGPTDASHSRSGCIS